MHARLDNDRIRMSFVALLALSAPAAASPITWDGSCGNNIWTSQCGPNTNWDPESLPGINSDVSIPPGPVVTLGATGDCATIDCQAGLMLTGRLNVVLIGEIRNINVNSSFNGISTPGLVTLTGSPVWFTGRVLGGGTVENTGNLAGHAVMVHEKSAFINSSVMTVDQSISNIDNCTFTNAAGGTLTHTLNNLISGVNGAGTFRNYGTLKHQINGTSFLIVSNRFEQYGGQYIVAGSAPLGVSLENTGQYSGGVITLSDNASLTLTGGTKVFDGLTSISGQGNVKSTVLVGAELRVEQPLEVNLSGTRGFEIQSNGHLTLVDKLTNKGKARWINGTIQRETCSFCPGELANEGQFTINGGGILDATLSNAGSGTMRCEGGVAITSEGLIHNEGAFEHVRGNIIRFTPVLFGSFVNKKDYVRPDDPAIQDVIVEVPFELVGNAKILAHKGITSFALGGLKFNTSGSESHIQVDSGAEVVIGFGVHRVVSGKTARAAGDGKLRVVSSGFVGGLTAELGANFIASMGGERSSGSFVLGLGGRLMGPGWVSNVRRMTWDSGIVSGQLLNDLPGTIDVTGSCSIDGLAALVHNEGYVNHSAGTIGLSNLARIQNGADSDDAGVAGTLELPAFWHMGPGSTTISGGANGEFRNFGALEAELNTDQTALISCSFDNDGFVYAKQGPLIFTGPVAQLAGGRLTGGTWRVDSGASLNLPGTLNSVEAGTTLSIAGEFNDLETIALNAGDVTVRDDFETANDFINSGSWTLEGESSTTVGPGGTKKLKCILGYANTQTVPTLAGAKSLPSFICAAFENSGTIRPGNVGAPGPFNIVGNLVQFDPGVIEIELGGTAPGSTHDQVTVQGNATLDGVLHVESLPGYMPAVGQQFTVLTVSGTMTGQFDSISGPGQYSVSYQPHAVVLTVAIPPNPADLSGDGHVSGIDIAMLLGQWSGPLTYSPCPPFKPADINQDCKVNGVDLAILLAAWAP